MAGKKIYKIYPERPEEQTSSKGVIYKTEEIDTARDLQAVRTTIDVHTNILIGVVVAMLLATFGVFYDAFKFHAENASYNRDYFDLKKEYQGRLEKVEKQNGLIKKSHPEFFE